MTLYSRTVYFFECNAPGCEETTGDIVPTNPRPEHASQDAWRTARHMGWAGCKHEHYCPKHTRLAGQMQHPRPFGRELGGRKVRRLYSTGGEDDT